MDSSNAATATLLLGDERAQVADACRRLSAENLVVGTAGNVSIRVGDLVVISPSGVDYDVLDASLVGVHRLDGSVVEAPLSPSSELPLHLEVYARSDAGAIVHTHGPASTAMSTIVDVIPSSHYYTALFGGPVRVAPYARFGSEELAHGVTDALAGRFAALMGNHGAIVTGPTIAKAFSLVPYLEYICEVQLKAMSSGLPVRTLSDEEIEGVRAALSGYGQRPPAAASEGAGASSS